MNRKGVLIGYKGSKKMSTEQAGGRDSPDSFMPIRNPFKPTRLVSRGLDLELSQLFRCQNQPTKILKFDPNQGSHLN